MRILRLDSWDGRGGGAQDYVRAVCDELEVRGHLNRVLNVVERIPTKTRPRETYLSIPAMGPRRLAMDLVGMEGLRSAFEEEMRTFDPDLIQLHHFDAAFTTLAAVMSRLDRPIVFTAHDAELVCPISTLVRPGNIVCEGGVRPRCLFTGCRVGLGGPYNLWQTAVFDRWLAPRIRAYLCPSGSLTSYLDAHGYRPAVHLPSFARIPDAVQARETPPPPVDTPPTIGYLGRLEWYKGVHDLLDALALLRAQVPEVRLDIAGDGPYRPALEERARRLGVWDRVDWRGHLDGEEKERWFGRVHVVASPSNLWENFPLAALEALSRGRPVVATRIGGIPDIVDDGVSGHLVPIGRPDLLANALFDLLSTPEKARAFGREGRRRSLARYTPAIHVERLLAVYRRVLNGSAFRSGMDAQELLEAPTAAP